MRKSPESKKRKEASPELIEVQIVLSNMQSVLRALENATELLKQIDYSAERLPIIA